MQTKNCQIFANIARGRRLLRLLSGLLYIKIILKSAKKKFLTMLK